MGSQNGTDTKPTRDHLELLPKVDRWLVKLFKYRTRCVRGARAVRILPHRPPPFLWGRRSRSLMQTLQPDH